jgi:O-antigen/teichoic acid export membrane protein
MSLTRKVVFNSSVQMIGRVVTTLIALVTVKLLTNKLGPAGYGEYAAILNYIALFGTLADFGFYWILAKELTEAEGDKVKTNHIMGNILALRSFFALIVLSCAVIAIYILPTGVIPILNGPVKLGVLMVAISTFWQTLNMTFVAIFQANYRMDRPVIADIVGRVVSLAVLLPFLWLGLNVAWLVSAMIFGAVANYYTNVLFARQYTKVKFQFDKGYWKRIFRESSVLGIVSVLALIYFKIDSVILSIYKSAGDVGIYAAPYKVIEIINYFPAVFMGVVFISLVQSWKDDHKRFQFLITRSVEAMFVLGLPIIIGGMILARPVMNFVTSNDYSHASTVAIQLMGHPIAIDGAMVLRLLLIAVWFDFFGNILGKGVIAMSRSRLLLIANVIAVIVNIGFNLLVIPRWSYLGAAMVTILTEALVLLVQSIIISKYIKVQIPWAVVGRTLVAVFIMAAIIYPLRNSNLLYGVAVGAIVFCIAAWKTKAISEDIIKLVLKRA